MEVERRGTDTYYYVTSGNREFYVVEMYDEIFDSYSYDVEEHTDTHTKTSVLDVTDPKLRASIIDALLEQKDYKI